jgi:hypothetical protein
LRLFGIERVLDGDRRDERDVIRWWVIRCEGNVILRMKVLGSDCHGEGEMQEIVNERHDVAPTLNSQGPVLGGVS